MADLIGLSLGRYHILEQLGHGGMANVYKAYDMRLERDVALKVILPDKQQSEKFIKRFEQEAKALAQLSHPNIVHINDSGEQDGLTYLVMDFIAGGTLKKKLEDRGGKPMPWQEAAGILYPIAQALQQAHIQKIIHRDVKPSNILIKPSGEPMLSDFGIAKMIESDITADITGTGAVIGTYEYMTPEQGLGKNVDGRADIYSLGVVFYEMVTGRKPYRADTPMAILHKQLSEPLPRPTKYVPGLPAEVEHVLIKALAKDAANRYQTAEAFAIALRRIAEGKVSTAPSVRLPLWILAIGVGIFALALLIAGAVFVLNLVHSLLTPVPLTALPAPSEIVAPSPANEVATAITLPPPTSAVSTQARINSKDGEEVVFIPSGEFIMGSDSFEPYFWGAEAPKHSVLLKDFWIYRTEVTNKMYRLCVEAKACPQPDQIYSRTHGDYFTASKYENYPVIYVNYPDALSYCQWTGARLPTEAEWEKAARGTDGRLFPWGNAELTQDRANFCDIGCPNIDSHEVESSMNDGFRDLAQIASFPNGVSPYGIYDMAGNALEWVVDWMGNSYYSQTPYENPTGPASGNKRVIKGGSWYSGRAGLRPAARASLNPKDSYDTVGFRCAMDSP